MEKRTIYYPQEEALYAVLLPSVFLCSGTRQHEHPVLTLPKFAVRFFVPVIVLFQSGAQPGFFLSWLDNP
jgi:hypothetical protein